jgi:hypothetical protein
MDEKLTVPYIVYESSMARAERQHKRLWIALIVAVVMIVASNLAWLYVWNSYEYVGDSEITYSQDGEGVNIIGDRNNYGTENGGEENQIPKEEKWTE